MTLPPDLEKVLNIAEALAHGMDKIGISHLREGCARAMPGDAEGAFDLYELLLDHVEAELDIGLHDAPRRLGRQEDDFEC
jgi:hypothetical protein